MSKTEQQKKRIAITAILLGLLALSFYIGFFFLIKGTQ